MLWHNAAGQQTNNTGRRAVIQSGVLFNAFRQLSTIRMFRPIAERKVKCMANQTHSLAHTKWVCKYHIVFTPKYRRKEIYGQLRKDIQEYIRTLCKYKGVEIIEGHMMLDHVHLLLRIPPKISVSSFMGYLRGKIALMIFEYQANLKHKYTSFVISPSAFRQTKSAQL